MFQQTPQKRVPFPRTLTPVVIGLFVALSLLSTISVFITNTETATAATTSTLNFQARLENSAGNIAPDGYYNVEFKLYSVSSGGSALWTETWYDSNGATAGNDNRLQTRNGYLTANLGNQTAFPGTINWDQDLWITLNIGGTTQTATPAWDGEMNPRLKLTAVPYAFRAGQLAQFNNGTGFTSTLGLVQPTGGNQTFQIQDQGAAGTYNLCIQSSTACGFAPASGSANYIQNQNASQQTSTNFWISGTGRADTVLQAPSFDTPTAVALNIGSTNATSIVLGKAGVNTQVAANLSVGTVQSFGAITVANDAWFSSVDSAGTGSINMFKVNSSNQIQVGVALNIDGGIVLPTNGGQMTLVDLGIDSSASAGAKQSYTLRVGSTNALTVYGEADGSGNAQNIRVAVGSSINPAYTLDVGGDINTSGDLRTGTTSRITAAGVLQNVTANASILTSGTVASGLLSGSYTGITAVGTLTSLTTSGVITSTLTTGTAPFNIASTTLVTNLNADMVDGQHASAFAAASGSASYIQNQNAAAQTTANFWVSGTGRADTSFLAPAFDAASAGTLSVGNTNATTVNIATNAIAHTIAIGNGAAAQGITIGSFNGASATTLQGGTGNVNLNVNQSTAGVIVKTVTNNSATAFQVKDQANTTILNVDTATPSVAVSAPLTVTVNSSSLTTSLATINQTGAGDSTIKIITPSENWIMGADQSDTSSFNIGSATSNSYADKFGNTNGYYNDSGQVGSAFCSVFTPKRSGSIFQMLIPILSNLDATNRTMYAAVYANNGSGGNPGTLVTSGSTTFAATPGYISVPMTSTAITGGTPYWLCFQHDGTSATNNVKYDPTASNTAFYWSTALGTWAANPTGTAGQFRHAILGVVQPPSFGTDNLSRSILKVSGAGDVSIQGTQGSSTAFQVLDMAGNQTLSVDTSRRTVKIGTDDVGIMDIGSANISQAGSDWLSFASNAGARFYNRSDVTTSFVIQNAAFSTLFNVDTVNNRVQIGSTTADSTGVLLVLDTKNTAGDPTGTNGAMYYSSATNRFRCYENGAWKNCETATYLRKLSDQSTTTASPSASTISNLSFGVQAGETYSVECNFFITTPATTTGFGVGIFATGTPYTGTAYSSVAGWLNVAGAPTENAVTTMNGLVSFGGSKGTTPTLATFKSILMPTSTTNIIMGFNTEISGQSVTVLEGSWCTVF